MSKHFSRRRWPGQLWPIVFLSATTACVHAGDPSAAEEPAPPRKPAMREHESVTGVAGEAGKGQAAKSTDLVGAIAGDLAQRLGVGVAQIEVVSMDAMTWNDSSLGCPQPGQSYLQALTPGVRVVLRNGGQLYEYHANNSGTFVYCPNPTRTPDGLDRQ